MSTNNTMTVKSNIKLFGKLNILVTAALFVAMSIVMGKFLAFNIGNSIRISLGNLPIQMAGIFFGPVVGAVTGIIADIIGCIMKGYAINPIITLGAGSIGFVSGIIYHNLFKKYVLPRVALSVFLAQIVGSMTITSIGLILWYHTPMQVIAWRVPISLITGAIETAIIYVLLSNRAFCAELEKMIRK